MSEEFKTKEASELDKIVNKMLWNIAVCGEKDKENIVVSKQAWFTFGYEFLNKLNEIDEKLAKLNHAN